jgi:hypothetical protein
VATKEASGLLHPRTCTRPKSIPAMIQSREVSINMNTFVTKVQHIHWNICRLACMEETDSREVIVVRFITILSQITWRLLQLTIIRLFVGHIPRMAHFSSVLAKVRDDEVTAHSIHNLFSSDGHDKILPIRYLILYPNFGISIVSDTHFIISIGIVI